MELLDKHGLEWDDVEPFVHAMTSAEDVQLILENPEDRRSAVAVVVCSLLLWMMTKPFKKKKE